MESVHVILNIIIYFMKHTSVILEKLLSDRETESCHFLLFLLKDVSIVYKHKLYRLSSLYVEDCVYE